MLDIARVAKVVDYAKSLATENVDLKQQNADLQSQLAKALANDAADADTIATAKANAEAAIAEAATAKQSVASLQVAINADASEDEQINALLDGLEIPATPVADPAPVVEVASTPAQ